MRPGLRFQIVLVLLGVGAIAFGLVGVVALATFARYDRVMREALAQARAVSAVEAVKVACPRLTESCVEHTVARLAGVRYLRAQAAGERSQPTTRSGVAAPLGPGTVWADLPPPGAPYRRARGLLLAFLALDFFVVSLVGATALFRGVVRPVEALADRAEAVARLEFGEEGSGHQLGRLGASFQKMVRALAEERARVAEKIEALEEANRSLTEAQAQLVRSEKLATVGRLSAGVAHEIGNPLGGLIGYLEILSTRLKDDEANRPLVEGALTAARRIDATIHDLLDFSRPAAAEAEAFELAAAVEEAKRLVETQKRLSKVRFEVDLPRGAPPARAPRRHVVQVLVNLFLNAADAMDGEGTLRVSARLEDRTWCLEVADTGPGIPEEALEQLFEPFFTTKAPGEGTGLGLAISLRLAEQWGGSLCAKNAQSGGAVFTLTLPAKALN
ncbi:MAG: HAMP domain-containing protein [Deltaproteobacteria bacterium]|nr:MAG: HAMP domain-containing protein [Deltaproteobacteria bacterium]